MIEPCNDPRPEGPLQNREENNSTLPDSSWACGLTLPLVGNEKPSSALQDVLEHLLAMGEMEYKYQPIPLYDVIGRPRYQPETELLDGEIEPELARLLQQMAHYDIQLDVLVPDDYSSRTIYRFLTEELFHYETLAVGDDWTTRFVYEEFHPNHRHTVAKQSDTFLNVLCSGDFEKLGTILADQYVYRQIEPYRVHVLPEVKDHLGELLESWWPKLPVGGLTTNIQLSEDEEQAQATLVVQLAQQGCQESSELTGTMYLSRGDLWWFIERIVFDNWVLE